MHKFVLVLLAVLFAASAFGQSLDKPTRISVFVSNPWSWSQDDGLGAGYGVAIERRFSRSWSGELTVANEQHDVQPFFFNTTTYRLRTHPIDLVARYTFSGGHPRWRPYIGAGARYVAAPEEPPNQEYENELTPEVTGGVEYNGGEAWSVRFDLKQVVRDSLPDFDEWIKGSIAVGWRF
jgi:outer membrane protein W